MSEICPSYPGQKGTEAGTTNDNTTPADSQKQANKGGSGKSIKQEDHDE
jgi:hypothetical protein